MEAGHFVKPFGEKDAILMETTMVPASARVLMRTTGTRTVVLPHRIFLSAQSRFVLLVGHAAD